jgi:AmmeMemoRadiSam system protein B
MDTLSRNGAFRIRSVIYAQRSRRQPLHEVEHGIEVLLPFLQVQLGQEFRLLPIVMGSLTDRAGGIDEAAERSVVQGLAGVIDDRTLLIVSTNFTHYGYEYNFVPFQTDVRDRIRALDFAAFERILNRDLNGLEQFFEESDSNIPGRLPLRILLQLLPERAAGTVLAYDTSGNVTGDWERSVSYAGIAFFDPRAEPPEQKPVRTLLSPPRHRPGAAAPETTPESAPEPHKEPEAPEESTDEQSAPSGPE